MTPYLLSPVWMMGGDAISGDLVHMMNRSRYGTVGHHDGGGGGMAS